MSPTSIGTVRYAGFWPRFCAGTLDLLICLPIIALYLWGFDQYGLFDAYIFFPEMLFTLFFNVYFVRRFGGTPGKLIVGLRILKVNGDPITYREATLRYVVDFMLYLLTSIALIIAAIRITDAEFHALDFVDLSKRLDDLTPFWYQPLNYLYNIWMWSELIVLLTNKKRRALHDFVAGTIVVHKAAEGPVLEPVAVTAE